MKKLKKFMLVLLTVVLVLDTVEVSAATVLKSNGAEVLENEAEDKSIEYAEIVGELFLLRVRGNATLFNPIILKNVIGEDEACIFDISGGGYIIVNLKDLSIPEYSPEGINPYIGIDNPVYNGPLNYLSYADGLYLDISENKWMEMSEFNSVYIKEPIEDKEAYINSLKRKKIKRGRPLYEKKLLKNSLVTWTETGECCGAIAAAICLKYYRDNVDYRYVEAKYNNRTGLIDEMKKRISASVSTLDSVVNGLNKYFEIYHPDTEAIGRESFNFLILKSKIRAERPVIVGYVKEIYSGIKLYHWVVAHGYVDAGGNGNYIIVNDGLGRNNVWLLLEETEMKYMVYFNK